MKIEIAEIKRIREELDLAQIVVYGIDKDGVSHVATHGDTEMDAEAAAQNGNTMKDMLGWPKVLCESKPLARQCRHCNNFIPLVNSNEPLPKDTIPFVGKCSLHEITINAMTSCKKFDPKAGL